MNKIEREAFLHRRKSGIGGSDISAIMGLNKWRTPLDIYNDKTSDTIDLTPNDILDLSSYLEDYTARKYADIKGYTVKRYNQEITHPKYSYLKGNIDRRIIKYTGDSNIGILECKAVSTYNFRKIEQFGLPDEYLLQMQFYFAVSNYRYNWGEFAVLNRDNGKLLIIPVMPDREIGKACIEAGKNFWENHVIPKIPPIENANAEKINLPKTEGKLVDLSNNNKLAELLKQYKEYSNLKSEAESLVDEVKSEIINMTKEMQAVICNNYKIYNTTSTRKAVDTTKLKKENLDIYNKYLKETQTITTRIYFNNNN